LKKLSFTLLIIIGLTQITQSQVTCEQLNLIVNTSSHNLFPFEFIFYAVLTIPSIIGAYIAKGLKNLVKT
jgi:hypothetical protein